MVVIPFWEHTQRVIMHSSCSFLPIPIKRENQREIKVLYRRKIKPKGNKGALQEEDHCAYRSALILSLWPIQVRFRLLFTTWLLVWVWDIVYDWLSESIIGSYSAFSILGKKKINISYLTLYLNICLIVSMIIWKKKK